MNPRAHPWLSLPATRLEQDLATAPGDDAWHCDLLVVGSGYGGAVAAARFAGGREADGKPTRVWVLERGLERTPGRFPSRFADLPGEVRFTAGADRRVRGADEGLFDWHLGSEVCALVASGLGGGSLINAGVMAEPDDGVFDRDWPAGIRDGLRDAYARAQAMLTPQPVPAERLTPKWRVLSQLATAAGQTATLASLTINTGPQTATNAVGVDLAACTRCGDCVTGCNQGAKGSLDTNYLVAARRRGAVLYCGAEVISLRRHPQGAADDDTAGWTVKWRHTARSARGDALPTEVRARRVVLAAGTLGSTGILLRSRGALWTGDDSPPLGIRFSGNGDGMVASMDHPRPVGIVADPASDPAATEPDRGVGPTITGLVRWPATDGGPDVVIQDFAVPAALRQAFGEITRTLWLFDGKACPPRDPFAVTDDQIERSSLYGVMGVDGADGRLTLAESPADEMPGLCLQAPGSAGRAVLPDGIRAAFASTVMAVPVDGLSVPGGWDVVLAGQPMVTVHPLGGAPMAADAYEGVVNDRGQVFSAGSGTTVFTTLAVLDGSIVPRALGINPALTITALAERAVPLLASDWGLTLLDGMPSPPPQPGSSDAVRLPPRPLARRRERADGPPTWTMRERQHGVVRIDGAPHWAQLELSSQPIPGFAVALQATRRVLELRHATLRLYRIDEATAALDAFGVTDEQLAEPACTLQLAGSVLLLEPDDPACPTLDRIVYRLAVVAADAGAPAGWGPGTRIEGLKTVHRRPPDGESNLWRALSEMALRVDGTEVGRLALDLGDLGDRGEALVRMTGLRTMPDALADLGAVAAYGLRRAVPWMLERLGGIEARVRRSLADDGQAASRTQRWPGPLRVHRGGGEPIEPDVVHTEHEDENEPWRLTRYRHLRQEAVGRTPVVLIHGLGMSGASFTHEAIPGNLASVLVDRGHDVWVLDLRSSIAHAAWRSSGAASTATVEDVALGDIPKAIETVCATARVEQVDVVAHCMGAVSFVMAALADGDPLQGRVRRVVLSQVTPLLRLSPSNRLRAFVASYLLHYLRIDELDATPDLKPDDDGSWSPAVPPVAQFALDALIATFPYGAGEAVPEGTSDRARRIRLRADAIFGQLFEGANLARDTFEALGALFGWAKVSMLSQALHMMRLEMVGNGGERNRTLHHDRIRRQFAFPLLVLHGQRNRVFDWRGSLRGWRMLRRLRGQDVRAPAVHQDSGRVRVFGDAGLQLAVFPGYGHLDTVIGENAQRDVFPLVTTFLEGDAPTAQAPACPPAVEFEPPWLGPMLGWLAGRTGEDGHAWLDVTVGLHPSRRRARTAQVAVVPVPDRAGHRVADLDRARLLPWPADEPGSLRLRVRADALTGIANRFAVLTLHQDVPLDPVPLALTTMPVDPLDDAWLAGGRPLPQTIRDRLADWLSRPPRDGQPPDQACFQLDRRVVRAADVGRASDAAAALTFALGSCLYPPGLFDRGPAQAALASLQRDAASPDGPQFLLLVGDQVYADLDAGVFEPSASAAGAAGVQARFERAYELGWGLRAFRAVARRLPMLPMLDDHEIRDGWQGLKASPASDDDEAMQGLAAYRRFQQSLAPPLSPRPLTGPDGPLSYPAYPGGVPLWVLDTRTHRTPRTGTTPGTPRPVDAADLAALMDWLAGLPPQAVKLVVSPVPLLPPERLGDPADARRSDTWSGFPDAAAELLRHIHANDIRRMVLLSGDSHLSSVVSAVTVVGDQEGPVVTSVVSSGLYAPWPFANQEPQDLVLDGPVTIGRGGDAIDVRMRRHALHAGPSWARVSIEPASDGRRLLDVTLRGADGDDVRCRVDLG